MKFNESKDGKLRASVQVKFRVGRDALIQFLAGEIITFDTTRESVQPGGYLSTRALIERALRGALCRDGERCFYVSAHWLPVNEWDRGDPNTFTWYDAEEVATETIDRLYPELKEEG